MDDQTSAVRELPQVTHAATARPEFRLIRRGYEPTAVDAQIERLHRRTAELEQQIAELEKEIAELERSSSPEAAVEHALEQFGQEVAGVLSRARETAHEITGSAQRDADELMAETRREMTDMTQRAERRVRELDLDAEAILAERDRIINDARELARQLLALAQTASDRFPAALEAAADAVIEVESE